MTTEPIIGFRNWTFGAQLHTPSLSSVSLAYEWTPGINLSRCLAGFHEMQGWEARVPALNCSCGFHAFSELPDACQYHTEFVHFGVTGAIAAWGRIAVHKKGFRAEKSKIVALANIHLSRHYFSELLDELSTIYNIPVVAPEDLEAVALEHGKRMRVPV